MSEPGGAGPSPGAPSPPPPPAHPPLPSVPPPPANAPLVPHGGANRGAVTAALVTAAATVVAAVITAVAVGGDGRPAAQPGPAAVTSTQESISSSSPSTSTSEPSSEEASDEPSGAQPVQTLPVESPAPEVSENARIEATPDSGPAGSKITLTGSGFAADERVRITFNGAYAASWDLRDVTASDEGGFVAEIKVPPTYADRSQKSIEVKGLDSDKRADTPFTVTK
ncbi:IPT/TIG domain-containing protein [Streptomyces sp. DpondAA-D4]|nr:IPT/TIG domain-containing protein [Streptomyces sp. DpondAA-D4]